MKESKKRAVIALGFDDAQSTVITEFLSGVKLTAEDLVRHTGLSRGKVYQVLKELTGKGFVARTDARPSAFSATGYLLDYLEENIESIRDDLITKVKRLKSSLPVVGPEEVVEAFERLGFTVSTAKFRPEDMPRIVVSGGRDSTKLIDSIAESEFKLGISFIDRTKQVLVEELLRDRSLRLIEILASSAGCLATTVFISPDLPGAETLAVALNTELEVRAHRPMIDTGVENLAPLVAILAPEVSSQINQYVTQIRSRKRMTDHTIGELTQKIESIERLWFAVESRLEYVKYLMTSEHFRGPRKLADFINEIRDPVLEISERERTNLHLQRKLFQEQAVEINKMAELVDHFQYLPDPAKLAMRGDSLEVFSKEFRTIFHEVDSLNENVLQALASEDTRDGQMTMNPFMFTIPSDRSSFTVNQAHAKAALVEFISKSEAGGDRTPLLVLHGPSGSGKTHLIKYVCAPEAKRAGLLFVHVRCPAREDLVVGLAEAIQGFGVFPEKMRADIRALKERPVAGPQDLIDLLNNLTRVATGNQYTGMLLVIDELENALPAKNRWARLYKGQSSEPFAFRVLRLLTTIPRRQNWSVIVGMREEAFQMLATLGDRQIESSAAPEPLTKPYVQELIVKRYDQWGIEGPKYPNDVVAEIEKICGGNPRQIVKICRELHNLKYQAKGKLKDTRITLSDLQRAQEILERLDVEQASLTSFV